MKPVIVICAAAVLLAGCALEKKGRWYRADTTEAQWKQDNYECTRDATYYTGGLPHPAFHWSHPYWSEFSPYGRTVPQIDPYLYGMCLDARGYTWQPENPQ